LVISTIRNERIDKTGIELLKGLIKQEEPYEARVSRTVLWGVWGENPLTYPTLHGNVIFPCSAPFSVLRNAVFWSKH
jgi:hypothetical protein